MGITAHGHGKCQADKGSEMAPRTTTTSHTRRVWSIIRPAVWDWAGAFDRKSVHSGLISKRAGVVCCLFQGLFRGCVFNLRYLSLPWKGVRRTLFFGAIF